MERHIKLLIIFVLCSFYSHYSFNYCALVIQSIRTRLVDRMHILRIAEKKLYNTPGIKEVLRNIAHSHETVHSKGFWFELETALQILRHDNQDKILAFHVWLKHPTQKLRREIDVITKKRGCIECKNIAWDKLTEAQTDAIIEKLNNQKTIIAWYNSTKQAIYGHHNLGYELWSRNKIPDKVKDKLTRHNITFVEFKSFMKQSKA